MYRKTTIAYLVEDGETIERLFRKGYISSETALDQTVQINAEIAVQRGLQRGSEAFSGPQNSLSGVLEGLAIKQLVSDVKVANGWNVKGDQHEIL